VKDCDLIGITELRDVLEREHSLARSRETIARAARMGIIPTVKPGVEYLVRRSRVPEIAEILARAKPGRRPRSHT